MEPNKKSETALEDQNEKLEKLIAPQASEWKYEIVYSNVLAFTYFHLAGLYGLYLCFTSAKWATIILACLIYTASAFGITAGVHRLWCHRAYKAKLPLQIILMVFSTFGFQYTVFNWVRDHRLHHKYSDTDADPHNATRGFFFAHIGWLLVKKHPEIKRRGKAIDISDIYANPVLMFQKKYAIPFISIVGFILPTLIPVYFWDETLSTAWHITMLRYIVVLNVTFLVNSLAHVWGYKPYDKNIMANQNLPCTFLTFGEGFHNYHHVFPWDYRSSELGNNYINLITKFIDFFAWLGWAYDLRTASDEIISSRKVRTGDGSGIWG